MQPKESHIPSGDTTTLMKTIGSLITVSELVLIAVIICLTW